MKKKLPPEIRKLFANWGRKGGKSGSREDKVRAGRASAEKRVRRLCEAHGINYDALPDEALPEDTEDTVSQSS
jgi:hypothetical protein